MSTPTHVRLTQWGKDHLVEDDGKETFCDLRIPPDPKAPRHKRLCVDCKREAKRRERSP